MMKCDSCGGQIRMWAHEGTDFHRSGDLIICHTCRLERLRALDYRRRVREEREKMEQPDWVRRQIEDEVDSVLEKTPGGEAYRSTLEQLLRAAEGAADLIRHLRPQCDHHGEYIHLLEGIDRARRVLGEWMPEHRSGRVGK